MFDCQPAFNFYIMIGFRKYIQPECFLPPLRQLHLSCALTKKNGVTELNQPGAEAVKELLENATVGEKQQVGDTKWMNSPYSAEHKRNQAAKANRPKINPRETSIILFPGQGVQYVGMGKSLLKIPEVKSLFKDAGEILGYNLTKLCLEGPKSDLDQTVYCQPAIFVASLAALQLMLDERQVSVESCVATAGFSLGEYPALVLANSLSFETGLKLVKQRAEVMQLAADQVRGGMLSVFLEPGAKVGTILNCALEFCRKTGVEKPVCSIANYLYTNCRVVGGNIEAIRFIEQNSKDLKIRRCRRIPVSGAFHTELMRPAAEEFAEILKKSNIRDPDISVHSNFDGLAYRDAQDIKKKLVKQIYRPVKWEQIMHILFDRDQGIAFPQTFELGPGKSLTTLLKYGNARAASDAVNIFA